MISELQGGFNEGFVSLSIVQDPIQYTNIYGREQTGITGVHKRVIPRALLHGCCEIYSGSTAPLHESKRVRTLGSNHHAVHLSQCFM